MIFEIIFAVLLLLLPTQLGRHFWPKETFLFGLKVDFLSPTLYLQDLVFIFLLTAWLKRDFLKIVPGIKAKKKYLILSLLYFSFIIFNLYSSATPLLSFFSWLRFNEFLLLGIMVSQNSSFVLTMLGQILPFTVIFEFFLGLIQVIRQSSLGIFWILGERAFSVFTPGIAKATFLGKVFLRPYGTFSHPNSLAGFILVALIFIFGKVKLRFWDKAAILAGLSLLFLSFSRTVWLTAFILGFSFFFGKLKSNFFQKKFPLSFSYLVTALFIPLILYFFSQTTIDLSSFIIRRDLARVAVSLFKASPLFGIGAGQFIIRLAESQPVWPSLYWLQPVHNIFLLVAGETGLIGLSLFLWLIVLTVRRLLAPPMFTTHCLLLTTLFAIIFTGFFDHYWLTLIQNQMLFAVVLGLSFSATPLAEPSHLHHH